MLTPNATVVAGNAGRNAQWENLREVPHLR
jgi:hypothetical protein